jgi:hypothetical protein
VALQDSGGSPAGGIEIDCASCPRIAYYLDDSGEDGRLLGSDGLSNIVTADHLGLALIAPATEPRSYRATGPNWRFDNLEAQAVPGFIVLLPWIGSRE